MATLGDGTPITTVQDKEIVLTATNGEYFKMKIADLAEAVRQVMPVATPEKDGLMSKTNAVRSYTLQKSEEMEIRGSLYSLILIKSNSSGWTSLLLSSHLGIEVIYSSGDVSININDAKLIVYKKAPGESCYLKNNSTISQIGRVIVM